MKDVDSRLTNLESNFYDLAFLAIERISLVKDHIDLQSEASAHVADKELKVLGFVNSTKEIFKAIVELYCNFKSSLGEKDRALTYDKLENIYQLFVVLQKELSILPKSDGPVELYRFIRLLNKQIELAIDGSDINYFVHLTENPSFTVFKNTPADNFNKESLAKTLQTIFPGHEGPEEPSPSSYHFTISRFDAHAPLYWPVLAHEVGHQVMSNEFTSNKKILADFSDRLPPADEKILPSFKKIIDTFGPGTDEGKVLESWLTELWCDLFAVLAIGPSFLFAQRAVLLFAGRQENKLGCKKYPPNALRLMVLYAFAKRQYSEIFEHCASEFEIIETSFTRLIEEDTTYIDDYYNLAQWFLNYFLFAFNLENNKDNKLHKYIDDIKNFTGSMTYSSLDQLVSRLSNDYPVPSLRIKIGELAERETYVQEVLFAAWLSYEKKVKRAIFTTIDDEINETGSCSWDAFILKIYPELKRFKQSVLRSLQISEWVDLLKQEPGDSEPLPERQEQTYPYSLLNDIQIKELLVRDELKVIPLIDFDKQRGSTSLDLRLGPSFQIYQPNQSGVIDFTIAESVDNVVANSAILDLDYLGSIVLAPGQFVLAHTMEYMGLPDDVAGQLEGRSSFARLGIQIHMTANLIDPGFHGAITFEILNAGPNPIRLYPGYRIGQLRLFKCIKPAYPYNLKGTAKYKGHLAHSSTLLAKDYEIKLIEKAKPKM